MTSLLALVTGALTLAAGPLPGPVTGLSITPVAERTAVSISMQGGVDYRDFTMQGPHRIVLDLYGAQHRLPAELFLGIQRGGVTSIRSSQYSDDVVRIVLELSEPLGYDVRTDATGLRVSLENPVGAFEPWNSAEVAATAVPLTPPLDRELAVAAQVPQETPINIEFVNTPIQDVLLAFAATSGRSIVAGAGVQGTVTAKIENQPWDAALEAILTTNGFIGQEQDNGIIEVHLITALYQREQTEPLLTAAYKINYATALEIATAIQALLGGGTGSAGTGAQVAGSRGRISVSPSTNTIIVQDIARVHEAIADLIGDLDQPTPQVTIQAKIVFVSRTDLNELGITYDLKDSAGNQLNVVAPGALDANANGVIELPDEVVDVGTNVVALGGNSVAALGNATNRVAGPTLTLLTSLLVGRHTLISFIEALETSNLSEVQASPLVRVSDNQTAEIRVGEDTPLRVIDAAAGAAGAGGALPVATVQIQETGIRLLATPHVTAGNVILLELEAERSAPQLAESDLGFIFNTQTASTQVLVQDGQTVVIGGLTVTEQSEVRSGIPLLMKLPLIGGLFRVTRRSSTQRDLIILVTPHIVRPGRLNGS